MDWVRAVADPEERARRLAAARAEFDNECVIVAASEAKGERELVLARAFPHPRDKRIRFVESEHKYYLDGKRLPISVTGFYSRYFDHFDADAVVSKNLTKWGRNPKDKRFKFIEAMRRLGVSDDMIAETIKYAWTINGERQSSLGTALHRAIELTINGLPVPEAHEVKEEPLSLTGMMHEAAMELRNAFSLRDTDVRRTLAFAGVLDKCPDPQPPPPRTDVKEYQFFEKWRRDNPHLVPIRAEMNCYAEDMLLAGQLDALWWNEKEQTIILVDFKRSRSMEYEAFMDRRGKPPFENFPDTNFG